MTILDTNVISALMQTEPDERVAKWLNRQPNSSVWTTSITVFEIRYGLALLPEGRRRSLEAAFDQTLMTTLGDRALDFDGASAVPPRHWQPDIMSEEKMSIIVTCILPVS